MAGAVGASTPADGHRTDVLTPALRPTLYTAAWLLPLAAPPIANGAVAVDATGRITYVGPRASAPAAGYHLYALGDAVLLPGLVAACIPTADSGLANPDLANPDLANPDLSGSTVTNAIAAAAAAGITTVATTVRDDADRAALLAAGVRAIAYHPVAGPAPADRESALAALATTVARTRAAVAEADAISRVIPGVSIAPMYAVHEDLLLDAAAWAVAEQLPLAIAAATDPAEVAFIRDAAGPHADALRSAGMPVFRRAHSVVHLLAELGIAPVAGPLLVGGVVFDESDLALAAYYNCPVAPSSIDPALLAALLAAGIRVALPAISDLLPLAAAVATSPHAALHLATLGAAHALDVGDAIGSLELGKQADLCAFPLPPAALALAATAGPVTALLAAAHAPTLTLVAGSPPAL